jgi:hypothetical protein
MKKILVDLGDIKKIMAALNVTNPTVRSALRYETHTHTALRIREMAFKLGGRIYEKDKRVKS